MCTQHFSSQNKYPAVSILFLEQMLGNKFFLLRTNNQTSLIYFIVTHKIQVNIIVKTCIDVIKYSSLIGQSLNSVVSEETNINTAAKIAGTTIGVGGGG